MTTLNRRSLRHSIADGLRERVVAGEFGPGDRLPGEPELARSLGVSRSSLRAAIALLEEDGLLRRLHGSGTYVTDRPLMRNDLSRNFGVSSMIAAMGLEPGTVDETCAAEPASPEVAAALGIEVGAPTSMLRRGGPGGGRRVGDGADGGRRGRLPPRPRGPGVSDADLVVGVDVGSQGTCAQAIAADGAHIATSYVPHTLSYPHPGWAEQDAREWLGAVAQALLEVRRAVGDRPLRAISFGSQLDGMVPADASGEPLGPALIWMDRRAGAECAAAGERIDPARLRSLTGCNLDPGHVAAKIAWLAGNRPDQHAAARWFLLPGSFVAWRASGEVAVDHSNASSSMLLDVESGDWCDEACAAFGIDPGSLAPVRPADSVLGPVAPWLREAAGLDASTLVVLGCGDEMAATLGAGVVEPGAVCDVMGTAEPVCAVG